ncbi:sel1 repeat family protein [Aestuariirhabdus sp. Z084]|uniref:tetratricopeptide repeat protein n=1 Tax=Aestuariirhabdus haliotis TaxID=2918751 RepID=UPI00201B3793|nr:tetratricopeptide repeat protein [Aestuariirhabdus haliotis]MCL6417484.1 sel1 repeat family protein [Aestuariirhabdus haliotis]MCL6421430.1 sel1 repeat family protein [Aestuariirhabdus haliotis]
MTRLPALLSSLLLALSSVVQADLYTDTQALFNAGKTTQAIAELKKASDAGDASAKALLGQAYETGNGVEKDLEQAFALYKDSAQVQNPLGQYYIGQAYFNGRGADRNLISAYLWLTLSGEQASPVQQQAQTAQQQVAAELNPLQLEKAQLLVEQLKTLYLD